MGIRGIIQRNRPAQIGAASVLAVIAVSCSGASGTAAHSANSQKDAAAESKDGCVGDKARGLTQAPGCMDGSVIQPTQPDAAFDFSGPDIIQFNQPPTQDELGPPRMFDEGCGNCGGDAFCDRDRCVNKGRGGTAYVGGMLGQFCYEPGDPLPQMDPKFNNICNGFVCMDHVCFSCRTDAECCPPPKDAGASSCVPGPQGTQVCLWWARIGSNICFDTNGLKSRGLEIPKSQTGSL